MILADLVHSWLEEDGSYVQGLALYRQTGGTKQVAYFEQFLKAAYVDPDVKAALRKELEMYASLNQPSSYISAPKMPHRPAANIDSEPEPILKLREKAVPIHKRYSHLKAELYAEATRKRPSKRKLLMLAREIMRDVLPLLDGIYDQIREWQRTGEIPDMPRPLIVEETVKKMKQVNSLATRLSQVRRKLKGELDEITRAQYEKEVVEKGTTLAELRAELGLTED